MAKKRPARKGTAPSSVRAAHTAVDMANFDQVKNSYRPLAPGDLTPAEKERLAAVRAAAKGTSR